jgi:uncharacterized membrane protein YeaQ/YmgE (transglycosylase-associated protein family)
MDIVWMIVPGFGIGVMAKPIHPGKGNMGFVMALLLDRRLLRPVLLQES